MSEMSGMAALYPSSKTSRGSGLVDSQVVEQPAQLRKALHYVLKRRWIRIERPSVPKFMRINVSDDNEGLVSKSAGVE